MKNQDCFCAQAATSTSANPFEPPAPHTEEPWAVQCPCGQWWLRSEINVHHWERASKVEVENCLEKRRQREKRRQEVSYPRRGIASW